MSREFPMNEMLDSLLSIRAELEREREKVEAGLADIDRVIALLRSRNPAIASEGRNQESPHCRNIPDNESKSEPAHDRYQEMAIDALMEAGANGLAPQKLRDDLGLEQQRFKVLVRTLLAESKIRRIGERGRGVRYVLPKLVAEPETNGSARH
jgi:hypothetical protein